MSKCRYNLSKDCHGRDCVMCVIEDIKAEIKGLIEEYEARCERFHYKPYKPTKGFPENGVAPRNPIEIESRKWGERAEGLERALKIIDKHINGKESDGEE